jgi:hypothetical protein
MKMLRMPTKMTPPPKPPPLNAPSSKESLPLFDSTGETSDSIFHFSVSLMQGEQLKSMESLQVTTRKRQSKLGSKMLRKCKTSGKATLAKLASRGHKT